MAALVCLRESLGLASGAAGATGAGNGDACSFSAWISSGNSSGEEDGLRDGRDRVLKRCWTIVSPQSGLFLCVGSDEDGSEGVTQDEVEVPEGVGKVEGVAEVVGVVDFVGVQGGHVVEFGINGEVVDEMEEEEGMGLASVLVPVEGEAVEGKAVEEEAERH